MGATSTYSEASEQNNSPQEFNISTLTQENSNSSNNYDSGSSKNREAGVR